MNRATTETEATAAVPPEEVARRIAEYRRISFERQLPAQVVYAPPKDLCPWPGCELRILGIRFQLESMGDPAQVSEWFASWWNGPGLVGRCPGCNRYVVFDVTEKRRATDLTALASSLLPEDWHQKARLVTRPG
jgi:hypothetical protein